MIKGSWLPGCSTVAGFTRCGEPGGHVIRRSSSLESRQVAPNTGGGSASELSTDVTGRTGHCRVLTGKREARAGIVVKGGRAPGCRCVAGFTGSGEASRDVVRICSFLEGSQMAAHASGGRACKLATHVARSAGDSRVFTGEREAGLCVVVKGCGGPATDGVAGFASSWETGRDVVGSGCPLECRKVAADAGGGGTSEFAADMAGCASHCRVFASKREACAGIVIEARRSPVGCCMASLASGWEASGDVIWIGRFLEVCQMAAHAGHRRTRVLPAYVTGGASHCRVFAS